MFKRILSSRCPLITRNKGSQKESPAKGGILLWMQIIQLSCRPTGREAEDPLTSHLPTV